MAELLSMDFSEDELKTLEITCLTAYVKFNEERNHVMATNIFKILQRIYEKKRVY